MPRIFVSYRRSDSQDITGRIYDHLRTAFGPGQVFKDVDAIPLGADFKQHLIDAVGQCQVLLAVVGGRWLDARDDAGTRRLESPDNVVRIEIEAALARGIPVVPVLVAGATMPGETELPPSLAPVATRQAIQVRPDPDFHRDMDRLTVALQRMLGARTAGETLGDRLARSQDGSARFEDRALQLTDALKIAIEIEGALDALHRSGTVHGAVDVDRRGA